MESRIAGTASLPGSRPAPVAVQAKAASSLNKQERQPTAPPAYRPQPAPKCLQPKVASGQPQAMPKALQMTKGLAREAKPTGAVGRAGNPPAPPPNLAPVVQRQAMKPGGGQSGIRASRPQAFTQVERATIIQRKAAGQVAARPSPPGARGVIQRVYEDDLAALSNKMYAFAESLNKKKKFTIEEIQSMYIEGNVVVSSNYQNELADVISHFDERGKYASTELTRMGVTSFTTCSSADVCAGKLKTKNKLIVLAGASTRGGKRIHAEQNLLLVLAYRLSLGDDPGDVEIRGMKHPCDACAEVLTAFAKAYKAVYKHDLSYSTTRGEGRGGSAIAQLDLKDEFRSAAGNFATFINQYHGTIPSSRDVVVSTTSSSSSSTSTSVSSTQTPPSSITASYESKEKYVPPSVKSTPQTTTTTTTTTPTPTTTTNTSKSSGMSLGKKLAWGAFTLTALALTAGLTYFNMQQQAEKPGG